jgi:type II secretory pathway predicted ATPase ExeA
MDYRQFFGFEKEVFPMDVPPRDILKTDTIQSVSNRFEYALRLKGVVLVTGEIGSGKTTALRYAGSQLHPSEYVVIHVTACIGPIMELYREIVNALKISRSSISKAVMIRLIKQELMNLSVSQKLKPVLIIDEASLLRLEVFSELHTLCQIDGDSQQFLPLILTGHSSLIDKLRYRPSAPLASRVIARVHLEGITQDQMTTYLRHHLKIAGMDKELFEPAAFTAIHQGSGGLLRHANNLARGALIAAAAQQSHRVQEDHVQLSSTELLH